MPVITWTTRPRNPFDSFYYYNTGTRDFVRIRLELNRTGSNPDPGVFSKLNRYVGFVISTAGMNFEEYNYWSVNAQNQIVYNDGGNPITLSNIPAVGYKVIDFSLAQGATHPTFVHHGNAVVGPPYRLPRNTAGQLVTEGMLRSIADEELGDAGTTGLGPYNETEQELGDAIFALYDEL